MTFSACRVGGCFRPQLFAILSVLLLWLAPGVEASTFGLAGPVNGVSIFRSGEREVRVEMVWPRGAVQPYPAVILLHGASGITPRNLLYQKAEALADNGMAVFVVHYFDGLSARAKANVQYYTQRERVIADAIDYVAGLPEVDGERIGLFGFSLGGFHALGLAGRDHRLRAVAAMGAGLSRHIERQGIREVPPTLLLHGDRDRTVPVNRAREVAGLLERIGASYEIQIYQGQGHTLRGQALSDSTERTVRFFRRHLMQSPGRQSARHPGGFSGNM